MKRHTLFIYITALLTMLSTVLPMSAQNKSFTVNRNDGASQKYSYSQGDRLVLSREDSQGKKYADFVEQQVYVGNDVHNIPLTSIESITFDTQATVDEGKTFTVQESGGKIEYGDISIDFPSGTFNSSTKVTVSEADMDELKGNANLSKYYKVNFYDGVRKDFKVSVKKNNSAIDDKNVKMQFVTQGFAESLNMEGLVSILRDVTNDNGTYVAAIPAMESPDDNKESEVYFGLTEYYPIDENLAQTRTDVKDYDVYWYPPSVADNAIDIVWWEYNHGSIVKDLEILTAQALKEIKSLGFEKPEGTIAIRINSPWDGLYFGPLGDPEANACHVSSIWGKKYGTVYLNNASMKSYKRNIMECTLIHELLHHYQQFYDPRWKSGGKNMATVLDEATAVWIEKFKMTDDVFSRLGLNAKLFIPCINPENEDIHDVISTDGKKQWGNRYQNTGYGMSVLIEYLSQKFGNEVTLEILKERKKMKKSSEAYNTIQFIETVAKNHQLDIFSQKGYKDFVEALGSRKVVLSSVDQSINFHSLLHERKGNGDIGVVNKEFEADEIVRLKNYAHGYGALVECLSTLNKKLQSINAELKGLENTKATVKQTTEGLTTWVYYQVGNEFNLIGQTKNSSPLDVSEIFKKQEKEKWVQYPCFLVTIKDEFKDETKILSNIEAKIEKSPVLLTVTPDGPIEFEAEGGSKTLTVTTNQPQWSVTKKTGDWFNYSTSKNEITVTADPNPTSDPRDGYLEICALNEKNEKVSEPVTIKVTQKSATSAATKYKWVKFVNVEFKVTAHKKSNDHSPEDWIDTWSSRIPSSISRQHMEENGLKVDVSDSGSLVKITKTLEFDRYDNNHWIYKAEIYIDPVKKLITSLYVYEKFWLSTDNGDQPQVLIFRAENIPLEKEKSGTGTKAKGTILNELSYEGQSGWVVSDYKWEGADDYQIKVTLSE